MKRLPNPRLQRTPPAPPPSPLSRKPLGRVSVLAVALLLPAADPHRNLVLNGDFAAGVTGWTVPGYSGGYARSLTVSRKTGSRSVVDIVAEMPEHLRSLHGLDGNIAAVSQCVAVVPDQHYDLGGDAFIPPGQEGRGSVQLEVAWWRTEGCVLTPASASEEAS